MALRTMLSITAGILCLCSFVCHAITAVQGKTAPKSSTWWIWTLVGGLTASSYTYSGAGTSLWVPASLTVGPLMLAVVSTIHGKFQLDTLDKVCVGVALLSVVPWILFHSPFSTLLICLSVDGIGFIPTLMQAYKNPKRENRTAWKLSLSGHILNLLLVETFSFRTLVYPGYMVLGVSTIVSLLCLRKNLPRKEIT